MEGSRILGSTNRVLVIDWPSRDVPESLVHAGMKVIVQGGPDSWSTQSLEGDEVVAHPGAPPERVDLVYAHRPLTELPQIIATATRLGAKALWLQSGRAPTGEADPQGCWLSEEDIRQARALTGAAGLALVTEIYVGKAARDLSAAR